jgi:SmpA / OmlA family
MTRRLGMGGSILAFIVFGVGLYWWLCASPLSLENYNQIQVGMTREQVESILGPPHWEVKPASPWPPPIYSDIRLAPEEWWIRDGIIQIWYEDQRVRQKNFTDHPCEVSPLTLVETFHQMVRKLPFVNQ